MIKPIYFPFTYVPHGVAQALAACFRRFIVYQPTGKKVPDEMQPWVEADVMEVRVPDHTDDHAIEKVVKDFRSFASLHYDSKNLKTAAFLGKQYSVPFFGETATSRIVSDLKKRQIVRFRGHAFGSILLCQSFSWFCAGFRLPG